MEGKGRMSKSKLNPLNRGTLASRMINPELFMKPNKGLMSLGAAAMVGCVAYILYMNLVDEKKTIKVSVNTSADKVRSKWD